MTMTDMTIIMDMTITDMTIMGKSGSGAMTPLPPLPHRL